MESFVRTQVSARSTGRRLRAANCGTGITLAGFKGPWRMALGFDRSERDVVTLARVDVERAPVIVDQRGYDVAVVGLLLRVPVTLAGRFRQFHAMKILALESYGYWVILGLLFYPSIP
jgi:hypothetical protein